jgi:hypothetical protein
MPWAAADGRFARLRFDPAEGARGARRLDLIQVLPPSGSTSRWETLLTPPRLRGPVFVGPVRWQVATASDDLLIGRDESATFEHRWGWLRGLATPLPAWSTADLRGWFGEDAEAPRPADPVAGLETALVGWQAAAEPLRFWAVPRPAALLVGSLAVIAIGLVVVRAAPSWRAVGVVVLAAGVGWLAVAWPQALAVAAYSAEPGAAVLIAVLIVRWLGQRRYRRHVLFLPAVARTAAVPSAAAAPMGSSTGRNGAASSRARPEPSTIDAPASQAGLPGRPV